MVLPALSTLEELVASVTRTSKTRSYTRIATGLSPELQRAHGRPPRGAQLGSAVRCYFTLKEYPPEASNAVILRYIERYQFLHDLGVSAIDLRASAHR